MKGKGSKTTPRRGFTIREFVTSCSTCMGKEGLLNDATKPKSAK